jgi:hypothetical protein
VQRCESAIEDDLPKCEQCHMMSSYVGPELGRESGKNIVRISQQQLLTFDLGSIDVLD